MGIGAMRWGRGSRRQAKSTPNAASTSGTMGCSTSDPPKHRKGWSKDLPAAFFYLGGIMQHRLSKADLTTLAAGICQELGQGWSVKPCDLEHLVKFFHEDGHGLAIHATWDGPGRLSITGEYPRDARN